MRAGDRGEGGAHRHRRRREPGPERDAAADDELGDVVELSKVAGRTGAVDDMLE